MSLKKHSISRNVQMAHILKRLSEFYSLPTLKAVVWLHETNGKNFTEIGEILGFTDVQAGRMYRKAKNIKEEHGK